MNSDQYNQIKPFKPIIDLFITSGQYIGGLDSLMDIYGLKDRHCPTCVARWIIERDNEIKEYEHTLQSL